MSFCRVEKYRSMLASTGGESVLDPTLRRARCLTWDVVSTDDCTCIIWNLRPNGADGIATPTAYSVSLKTNHPLTPAYLEP